MGNTKVTRQYILNELAKHLVSLSNLAEDEITASMFRADCNSKGIPMGRETARLFLSNLAADGIIVARQAVHNGHSVVAFKLVQKG